LDPGGYLPQRKGGTLQGGPHPKVKKGGFSLKPTGDLWGWGIKLGVLGGEKTPHNPFWGENFFPRKGAIFLG